MQIGSNLIPSAETILPRYGVSLKPIFILYWFEEDDRELVPGTIILQLGNTNCQPSDLVTSTGADVHSK